MDPGAAQAFYEGEIGRYGRLARRVERQAGLKAQQHVKAEKADCVEEQHGDAIGEPMLFALGVDAGERIEAGLERTQDR